LREQRRRHQAKKLDSLIGWSIRDWLSAIYWRDKLGTSPYFYIYDGSPGSHQYNLSYKEFSYHITVILISGGIFGAGIGEIFIELTRR
jgi:hypothetical protein